LTDRSREFAVDSGILKRGKYQCKIVCVQETKREEEEANEIVEEYKIIYLGRINTRNCVGVIMDDI